MGVNVRHAVWEPTPGVLGGAGLQRPEHQRQSDHLGAAVAVCRQIGHQLGYGPRAVYTEQFCGRGQRIVVGQQVTFAGHAVGDEDGRTFGWCLASLQ
jgi:hypothetical protein